jgi:hypothetical protein
MPLTKATQNVILPNICTTDTAQTITGAKSITATGSSASRSLQNRFSDWANILDYGADPTGATDSQPAIQAAVNALSATGKPWVLLFPPGDYRIEDEINLDVATQPFSIIGSGRRKTTFRPTDFGVSKAIFARRSTTNVLYITFKDFSIQPVANTVNDPIGIYARDTSRLIISDISAASLSNTVISAGPAFNSDWSNLELFACGYQPLYKTVSSGVTITTINGSPTITSSASVFAPGDVGQTVFVSQRDPGATQPSNSALTAIISAYNSPTSVNLDRNCFFSSSNRILSFDSIKGSITNGGTTLTVNASVLTAGDVGRIICIQGASGTTGEILVATITNVLSSTQCQISEAATATANNQYVWMSPTIYVGAEVTPSGQTPINDLSLRDVHIEQYNGTGLFLDRGTNVYSSILKFHGWDWNINNFSRSREALIVNGTSNCSTSQMLISFGCTGLQSGLIKIVGSAPQGNFDHIHFNAVSHGGYLFDFESDDYDCLLATETINATNTNWQLMSGLVRKSGSGASRKFVSGAFLSSYSATTDRIFALPPIYGGQFRSTIPAQFNNNEAISFFPEREHGFVMLTSDSVVSNGMFWYRVGASPNLQQVYAAVDLNNTTGVLNGTTGVNGKATISAANDGKIYIENRLGATRTFTLTFIGG